LHLSLFLLDLGDLSFDQVPRHTVVLTEVVNETLLLFLKGAKSPLQPVTVGQQCLVWALLVTPL